MFIYFPTIDINSSKDESISHIMSKTMQKTVGIYKKYDTYQKNIKY